MLVILEGVDGSGKSTIATMLADRLNMPVYSSANTPFEGQPVVESQAEDSGVMGVAIATGCDMILDRGYPSEYAYGKAYDRAGYATERTLEIDRMMRHLPHVIAHLRFAGVRPLNRMRDIDEPHAAMLRDKYDEFQRLSHANWLTLDAESTPHYNVMEIIKNLANNRPSNEYVYLEIARLVAKRSTCLSRRNGAVLVSAEGHVIATGYNGAPAGIAHPITCERMCNEICSGDMLDACDDVHAEENCIVQAALHGATTAGGTLYTIMSPCHRCARMLINAKIRNIFYGRLYGDERGIQLLRTAGIRMTEAS